MRIKESFMFAVLVLAPAAGGWDRYSGGDADAGTGWGLGARGEALGRSYAALADDVAAAYWNAAGLGSLERTELAFSYGQPFTAVGDVAMGDLAVAKPVLYAGFGKEGLSSLGTVAGGVAYRRAGGIYEADENGLTGRTFADTDVDFNVAYGVNVGKKGSFGITLHNSTRQVGDRADSGFGVDVGVAARPVGGLKLGTVVRNVVVPNFDLGAKADGAPLALVADAAYDFWGYAALTAGGEVTRELLYDAGAGLEVTPVKYVALRGGYRLADGRPRGGVGVRLGDVRFDYTVRLGGGLGDCHLVCFTLGMGKPPTQVQPPPEEEGYIDEKEGEGGSEGNGGTGEGGLF